MNAIVTGGAGFVGSNLVDHLIAEGHQVYVIDNLSTGHKSNLNPKAGFYHLDVRSDLAADSLGSDNVPYIIGEMGFKEDKVDVIFHLAALARIQPSFRRPHETLSANCDGTVRILDLARKTGARVVYAGSSSFYADPHKNPYAHSKWIGEEHCKMYNKVYGISTCVARFFNVYGNRHVRDGENAAMLGIFERQKMAGEPLTVTGTGEQRRDFTHVDDICEGLIAMSQRHWDGEVFNLGRGQNYSVNEVAAMLQPVGIKFIDARPGEAWTTLADLAFTKEKLGWEPKRNLPDYIASFLEKLNGN